MRHRGSGHLLALFLAVMGIPEARAQTRISLQEALELARRSAPELDEWRAAERSARARATGIDAAYDATLFGETSAYRDEGESSNAFAGDSRKGRASEIGIRKLFATGTAVELKLESGSQEIDFPPPEPPKVLPDGSQAPGMDPSSFVSGPNPSHTSKLSVTLSQPLWRNFLAREIDLRRTVAESAAIPATFRVAIEEQRVQAEAEQLFWALLRLEEQIRLTKDLVEKSKRYRTLMARRTEYGRADAVDVAAAEAQLVSQEGALLDLEIAARETRRRLAYRLGKADLPTALTPSGRLEPSPLPLPAANREAARKLAQTRRLDLALVRAQLPAQRAQKELGRELTKPKVDLFTSLATNGYEDSPSAAFEEAGKADKTTVSIGLKLEMPLGGTEGRAEIAAAEAEISRLESQSQAILRALSEEIDLAFEALESSRSQMAHAARSIEILESQLQAERKKFQQARSEEIVVLRYEMEVLRAKNARITALYNARIAEARLRQALHAYPTGKARR